MYADNPTWAKEDAPGAYKKGGTIKMKKGGMVKMQVGGPTSKRGIRSYQFHGETGPATSSSTQIEGKKTYGDTNKRKYIDLDADKGTMTKTKFDKNNIGTEKVKNIGTERVTNKIRKITSQKTGGATKSNYKTGGMVNSNAKITAAKSATGKVGGVTKAISKVAIKSTSPKGRVGGISKAPKKALPKAQLGAIVKAAKAGAKIAKSGANAVKKARAANYEKATSNLKRVEDWDAYHQGQRSKKVGAVMAGVPVAAAAVGSAMSDKPKSSTSSKSSTGKMSKDTLPKWMQNSLENKKRGGSKGKC